MEKNIQGAWSSMRKFAEGAAAQAQGAYNSAAKGAYDSMQQPTLKATFGRLSDTPLPRTKHTVSVVKGRAYIFGGEVSNGKLADNSMQVVILPSSSGILTTDYKELPARSATKNGAVPVARKGHSACVVANDIYIFGGELEGPKDSEPKGRVWAFDTTFNTWTALDPALNGPAPTLRCNHAAAVSEEPSHKDPERDPNYLPQQPPDPEQTYNDPPSAFSQGTMFIYGGIAVGSSTGDKEDEERENDLLSSGWAFSIPSRTWSRLPAPNGPAREKPSMAVVGSRLYLFGGKTPQGPVGGRLEWLEVSGTWSAAAEDTQSPGAGNPALWQWEVIDFSSTKGPSPRSSAALVHIITGPGRNQLLLLGGEIPEADDTPTDAWLFTLPAVPSSAEPVMGLIRRSTGMKLEDANANTWIEVQRAYADDNSDVIGALKDEVAQRKGFGRRKNMAFAKGTEVDGSTVLVWGGEGMDGRILGDGVMVTIDR